MLVAPDDILNAPSAHVPQNSLGRNAGDSTKA